MIKYEDLTICDNFLFQKVMKNKRLCKRTLELLLGIRIRYIKYPEEEKVINVRIDSKSVRLDVYVDDADGTVYNLEMQTVKDMEELVRRTRYYHSLIDIDLLEKGQDYSALNNVYVIFICNFSIFSGDLHEYTFVKTCMENPSLMLGDGTVTMFLSTKGTANDIPLPLKHFLDYVDGQPPADEFIKEIDNEVMMAKRREDWRREYMTLNILIAREKKKSEEQGRAIGRNEGIAIGRTEGLAEATMNSIRAVMQSLNYSAEKAMETLNIPKSEYGRYMQLL